MDLLAASHHAGAAVSRAAPGAISSSHCWHSSSAFAVICLPCQYFSRCILVWLELSDCSSRPLIYVSWEVRCARVVLGTKVSSSLSFSEGSFREQQHASPHLPLLQERQGVVLANHRIGLAVSWMCSELTNPGHCNLLCQRNMIGLDRTCSCGQCKHAINTKWKSSSLLSSVWLCRSPALQWQCSRGTGKAST